MLVGWSLRSKVIGHEVLPALWHWFAPWSCRKPSQEEEYRGLDHIYIACLRLYFLYYDLDWYHYAPYLRGVSSAIAEAAETADGAELDEEEWPEAVPDLEEEWPDTLPDLEEEWT